MTVPNVLHVLLSGIVGSTAYGLARPGSDVDRLGIFAAPTEQLHGLQRPVESHVTTSPDRTLHEAAKWCRLALSGNPTVMELVWLPADLYEVRTPLGDDLIRIRSAFLSAKRVRDAYLGYATQQFRRLESRGDGSFSADTRKRTAKHARHLKRLCHQGLELYTTGRLTVRVEDPDEYHEFGERVAADAAAARPLLAEYEAAFNDNRSLLPDRPDEAAVEAWLRGVRAHVYQPPTASTAPAPPADQKALRVRIGEALVTTRRTGYEGQADHRQHRYDARCALCAYDVDALTDALLAVLPAPADRATLYREAAAAVEDDSWSRRDRWGRYEREEYEAGMRAAAELLGRMADKAEAAGSRVAAEQQPGADEADVDLTDGPVCCPLCPNTVTLHTPNGARAHFTVVHPQQRITGRGPGPWPLLVTDGDEAQPGTEQPVVGEGPDTEPCDGCGPPAHPARECAVTRYGERCACDEPVAVEDAAP